MASEDNKGDKKGKSPLPMCKYGEKCYRRNSQHLQQYRHPKRKNDEDDETPEKRPKRETKKGNIKDFFKGRNGNGEEKVEATAESVPPAEEKSSPSTSEDKTSAEVEARLSEDKADEAADEDQKAEDAPASPANLKENLKQKFLVEMPPDFYQFWDFCKSIKPDKPLEALSESLGFTLVGPFDIVCGRHKRRSLSEKGKSPNYLRHWRYQYDPPEFLTVIKGDDKTQFHLGYYRDDPSEMPVFVAANAAAVNCTITPRGDNLFAAVKYYIDEQMKAKSTAKEKKESLQSLLKQLCEWAKKENLLLELKTKGMKERDKKVVCKTFHGAGIVVPVDDNDVGYRPVPETPGDLKKILKKIKDSKDENERNKNFDPLQELITLVQFANDECDYGEGLELGLDLFSFGGECFHRPILHLLPLAYQLLGRPQYADIITAHLQHRNSSAKLSEID